MSLIDDLLEAAAQSKNLELYKKQQSALQQRILNMRANAAIAGLIDMDAAVKEAQDLAGKGEKK